jgi:hypothetical protein
MSTISAEQLTIGTVIVYHLRPSQRPTHPERAWRGRIIKTFLDKAYSLDIVWVESLEEAFEGLTEYVLLTQITGIEGEEEKTASDETSRRRHGPFDLTS